MAIFTRILFYMGCILAGIGFLSLFLDGPSTFLIPVVMVGIVFLSYKLPIYLQNIKKKKKKNPTLRVIPGYKDKSSTEQ